MVSHTLRGSLLQTGANLSRYVEQIPDGEAFFARQHGGNAIALDVLHRGTELAVDLAGAVEKDNVLAGEIARTLAFGDQRVHKRVRTVAQRLQTLRLERHDLVGFRVDSLVNQGSLRLGKFTLDFEPAKHHRHYNRPRGDKPHYTLNYGVTKNRGRIEPRIPPSTARLRVTKVLICANRFLQVADSTGLKKSRECSTMRYFGAGHLSPAARRNAGQNLGMELRRHPGCTRSADYALFKRLVWGLA